jgi:hemoglobin-like flavoprotein
LLATLEELLGDAFTDAAREAWTAAYVGVADIMRAAGRAGSQAA